MPIAHLDVNTLETSISISCHTETNAKASSIIAPIPTYGRSAEHSEQIKPQRLNDAKVVVIRIRFCKKLDRAASTTAPALDPGQKVESLFHLVLAAVLSSSKYCGKSDFRPVVWNSVRFRRCS